eukprot:Em0057g3a
MMHAGIELRMPFMLSSSETQVFCNGILINFSLYCNGALAGVLPLTVISYDTTGLLLFTLYMYMSSSHAHRHCTPVGTWCWASSVLQPACPGPHVHPSTTPLSASGAYCPQIFMTPTSTVVYVGLGA